MATAFVEPIIDRILLLLRRDMAAKLDSLDTELGAAVLTSPQAETYNITANTNTLKVSVDGGSEQTITLTTGAARTAAQVVTDINTAISGATASTFTMEDGSGTHVRITSDTSGDGSRLAIGGGNANSVFGFYQGEEGKGMALRDIASWHFGLQDVLRDLPSVEVGVPAPAVVTDLTTHTLDFRPDIMVRVVDAEAGDLEVLYRRIYRYLRAVTEILKADDTLGNIVDLVLAQAHDYNPEGFSDDKGYLLSGALMLQISQEEAVQ